MRIIILCLLAGSAWADFAADFAGPPYPLEQSIVGIAGWEYRLTNQTDNASARIVATRWNADKPALMLKRASIKNAFPATKGDRVKVALQLAVNFPDEGPATKQVRVGFHAGPFGEVFFEQGPNGGLGYQADGSGKDGRIAVPRSELKMNSFYTFSAVVDFAKQKYDLTITGEKKDGTPFEHKATEVSFESKLRNIGLIYIITAPFGTAYLSSVTVESLAP